MATAAATVTAAVAKEYTLPHRLINFFARYPPRLYGVHFTGQSIPTLKEKIAIEGDKNAQKSIKKTAVVATATTPKPSKTPSPAAASGLKTPIDPETSSPLFDVDPTTDKLEPNPFLPYKNPATGRWRGPRVSLRRQADLFKLARIHGVESLLPPSIKATEYKEKRLLERGLAVKGTGVGQSVKGHKWERQMESVLQKRIEAMEKMPELIREWRMRGNGRGWKKYPK